MGSDAKETAPRISEVLTLAVTLAIATRGTGCSETAGSVFCFGSSDPGIAVAAPSAEFWLSAASNSAKTFTLPLVTFIFLSQVLYPFFFTLIVWSPGETPIDEGGFPIKSPSNSTWHPPGTDVISI